MFWFWFFAGPALALAAVALRGERKRARFVAERLTPGTNQIAPPATVIASIEGDGDGLRENLAVLAAQEYPSYELILAARTALDIPADVLPRRVIVVLRGAKGNKSGERTENLLAGVQTSRKQSEVLAFADAYGHTSRQWLRALVAPLSQASVGASTGFYWFAPEPPDFWSLLRSVWSAPVAGLLGPGDNPFVWAGSMAVQKEMFYELRIPSAWRESISESGPVTRAVHQAGLRIAFAPGATAAYLDRTGMRDFLRWAGSQMALARLYVPRQWWGALVAHFFYCGSMAAAIAASLRGSRGAEWVLVTQLGLGMLKGVNRATLAKAELPESEAWFKRHAWVHSLWVPLATWLWLGVLIVSALPFRQTAKKTASSSPQSRL
ncbi:MAG TPA: glycosyltransferase family 2 protein [Bryobacteraceae bacterium]|nr:glycosyltransferase family 2 protein [Bryobacteraceae bacterium]